MMKYIEYFLPITDESLKHFSGHQSVLRQWTENDIKYVKYVVDKDFPETPLHFSGTTIEDTKQNRLLFNDLYDRINDKSKNNITILKSLYDRVDADEILKVINNSITSKDKYLSQLLSDSNGYLVYHHQLESFISDIMGYNSEEAIRLRRIWNKKLNRDREVIITNENYWLIETRMPYYFTYKKC